MKNLVCVLFTALLSWGQCAPAAAKQDQQAVAGAGQNAESGTPITVGSVHRLTSSVYGGEQTIAVRLPKGYSDDPDRRWPVVYVLDGGPDQDYQMMAGLAAEAEYSGSFEPFILIGIQTTDRYSQLTPPESVAGRTEKLTKGQMKPNGAPKFRDYLTGDVIPWAEARYRTGRRVVLGASLAGLFVLDTFLERPEMFDDYIALTPSLWWDDGRIAREAASDLAGHAASDRRLYLTMGDEGYKTQANLDLVVKALEKHAPDGLGWTYVDRSGSEEHRTMYLISALDALRTFFLLPARTGTVNPFEFDGHKLPAYSPEAKANLAKGKCRKEIAVRVTFEEKNADPARYWGQCLLMKPGPAATAGNLQVGDR